MAAKISHILVWGFCGNPPRESIPIAQALTTPTAKNAKAIIDLSFPKHQQHKRHGAPKLRPKPELSAATPSLNAPSPVMLDARSRLRGTDQDLAVRQGLRLIFGRRFCSRLL
jgi:hypothetical protein